MRIPDYNLPNLRELGKDGGLPAQLAVIPADVRDLYLVLAENELCICCGKRIGSGEELDVCARCEIHLNAEIPWPEIHADSVWDIAAKLGLIDPSRLGE